MRLLLCLFFSISALANSPINGEIIGTKKNCSHAIIKKAKTNLYFVGKITEGNFPNIGDLVEGEFESGQHYLNNTKSLHKFEFFTKSLVNGKVKANEKLKEFCQ